MSDQVETPTEPAPPSGWRGYLLVIGPGIAIAATGVGAGDMVAASVAGAELGLAVVWAAVVGALLKGVLNEGLARWQLATGTTILEGWVDKLGRWVQVFFIAYLVLWTFFVAGALMSACGLAGHALAPALSVKVWAVIHSVVGVAFVVIGGYEPFERVIKVIIGLMFVTLVGCAMLVQPPWRTAMDAVTAASVPPGSVKLLLGTIGGVGGSLTLLSYGYWIRERGWRGREWAKTMRVDVGVAYLLTGLFGVAVVVLAAVVLHPQGLEVKGNDGILALADMIAQVVGPAGHWLFLLGFCGAVATSLLGVWQGVPYLFCDFMALAKRRPDDEREAMVSTRSAWYRGYLVAMAILPMTLLWLDKPVQLVVVYAVIGALFMPFLAATLLYLNSREEWVGELRNGPLATVLLLLSLALFAYLCGTEISGALGR